MPSHDQMFKTLFQTFLGDLLSLAEPEALSFLAGDALRLLDREIFTGWPEGRRREVDLLAVAPVRGEPGGRFLVHVEVERKARSTMGQRLWGYANLLQGRHAVPVLTILVNLKGGRGGIYREAVRKGTPYREVSSFVYTVFNLTACQAEEYLGRTEPLAWALAALMRPGALSRPMLRIECLRRIGHAALPSGQDWLLANCVTTYLQLDTREAAEYETLLSQKPNQEVHLMELTWADKLIQQGMEKGIEKGRIQGIEQGIERGIEKNRRDILQIVLTLLGQRFGKVPRRVQRQVEGIDSTDRLKELASKVLTVGSLGELGLQ